MKGTELVCACTAEGIEEDILDILGLESVPTTLVVAIKNRLYQHTRDTKDWVKAQAGTEMNQFLDRLLEV